MRTINSLRLFVMLIIFLFPKSGEAPPPVLFEFSLSGFKIEIARVDLNIDEEITKIKMFYTIKNIGKTSAKLHFEVIQPLSIIQEEYGVTTIPDIPELPPGCCLLPWQRRTREIYDRLRQELLDTSYVQELQFVPEERRIIEASYAIPTGGEIYRSIRVDPSVKLNGVIYSAKVNEYSLKVNFPSSAKKVLYSSHSLTRTDSDWQTSKWSGENVYLFAFSAKWTELDIDVNIQKSVDVDAARRATVTLVVTNNGNEDIDHLELMDVFAPELFAPVNPKDDFVKQYSKDSDPQYIWRKEVVELRSQDSLILEYTVKLKKPIKYIFHGTRALYKSSIVAISNDVSVERLGLPGGLIPGPSGPVIRVCVIPTGFDFDFKKKDHHLDRHKVHVESQSFSQSDNKLTWTTKVNYNDKNADDKYRWSVCHTILRIEDAFFYAGKTSEISCSGGSSTHNGTHTSNSLKNFTNATVLLAGWWFDFTKKDHHIKTVAIRLKDVIFDQSSGKLTWNAEAKYRDKKPDDNYKWMYWYQIVAFNEGAIRYTQASGSDGGRDDTHFGSIIDNSLQGYQNVAVIPMGWQFTYSNKDHHINEHSFRISNVNYTGSTGTATWLASLNYCDKNFDDDYSWKYYVAVLTFNNGEARPYSIGPYTDNGGSDHRDCSLDLDDLFTPITWYDTIMNGTEEGIDCGGLSPAQCMDCVQGEVNRGNAESRHLFSLKNPVVRATANQALLEYAQDLGAEPGTLYSGVATAHRYVQAIAWFVDSHMVYVEDKGDWKGPQKAARTINKSGSRPACTKDFCGDCEDFAILRAALLRSIGYSWKCIFCANHHSSIDQGQASECVDPDCEHDKNGGHSFNIVYYQGRYRILDYGTMFVRRYQTDCWCAHATDNVWNDHYGKYRDEWRLRPYDGKLLINYPGNPCCPTANWNWRTYYGDICR